MRLLSSANVSGVGDHGVGTGQLGKLKKTLSFVGVQPLLDCSWCQRSTDARRNPWSNVTAIVPFNKPIVSM